MEGYENRHGVPTSLDQVHMGNESTGEGRDVRRLRRQLVITTAPTNFILVLTRRSVSGYIYTGELLWPLVRTHGLSKRHDACVAYRDVPGVGGKD